MGKEQIPESLKRLLGKEEEKITKLSRQEFWSECEDSLQNFSQMELQAGIGRMGMVNLMNRARRFEADPDFRVEYQKVKRGMMEILQIETKPKRLGFKTKDDK